MAVSFAFIGILFMLDVLFFVNYLAVKWIRAWTDQREEQLAADRSFTTMLHNFSNRLAPLSSSLRTAPNRTTEYLQAIFMDVVHRERNSVHKFEKWRELPYACGKWSTVALVLFSLSLLSADFIVSTNPLSGRFQLCVCASNMHVQSPECLLFTAHI